MADQKTALIIATNFGVEEAEIRQPLDELTAGGVKVSVASPDGGAIQTVKGDKDWASTVQSDLTLSDANPEDYDLLVIPGGTVNADTLRIDKDAQRLIVAFANASKPVGAICHGPWLVIDADLAKGKTLTSWKSLKPDLENAGATWVDQEVKRCPGNGWVLITSRNPGDLPAFDKALLAELHEAPVA